MELLPIWFLITFSAKINRKRLHGWNKIAVGRGLEKNSEINNVVSMLNDMKDFSWLDLKYFVVLFYIEFSSNMSEFKVVKV